MSNIEEEFARGLLAWIMPICESLNKSPFELKMKERA